MTAADDEDLIAGIRRVMPEIRAEADPIDLDAVPGFRLLHRLGVGGMGIVFAAEQLRPPRRVALKLIRPDRSSPTLLARFEHEAAVLAKLQHPGIAQIHASGSFETPNGPQPFFAMELVDGEPLLEHADSHALDVRARLRLVAEIGRAVHYAHQKGVIHRDLKPSNILVDSLGQPKVLDFGVARLTASESTLTIETLAGQLVGTVAYMSPEQLAADLDDIDVRSDVYALGVVAFELLSGESPRDVLGKPITAAIRAITETEPRRLGAVDPALRGDVELMIGKAIDRDRDRRYQSADDLANDIERYLSGLPILARPPTTAYQLRRFVGRHRAIVLAAAVAVVSLVTATAVSTWQMFRALDAEATAEERRQDAEREAERAVAAERTAEERRRQAERETRLAAATIEELRNILDVAAPSKPGQPATVLDAVTHAATRVHRIDDPLIEAAVRDVIGTTFSYLGQLERARPHLELALGLLREHRPSPHPDIARCLNQLAILTGAEGDDAAAERLYRESLAIYEALYDGDHSVVARGLGNLGGALHELAKARGSAELMAEARDLVERAIAMGRRLGEKPAWVATYLSHLAAIRRDSGDPSGAEATYREAIAQFEETPFARDTMANIARQQLAEMLKRRGKYVEARRLLDEALSNYRDLYPEDSAYIQRALRWLEAIDKALADKR